MLESTFSNCVQIQNVADVVSIMCTAIWGNSFSRLQLHNISKSVQNQNVPPTIE